MSFYKRSFHSFLDQTRTKTMPFNDDETSQPPCESIFGLKTFSHNEEMEIIRSVTSETKDLGGIGFGEEANGLMLCTEYLGFESYNMRMSKNEVANKMTCHAEEERRKTKEENAVAPARERKREFPPPLSSLNGRGQRSFYLRPVRKDGRLELTQVMIDRPEIFHASRENGRLRLHLVDVHPTRKDEICDGNLRWQKGVDKPIRGYCDSEEIVDLEDEPKGHQDRPYVEYGREINEDNDDASEHQDVDLSTINDARKWRCKSSHEVSLNSYDDDVHFDDEHDAREWRYKNCCKSMNHDENDNHHHHHHHRYHQYHHIHPYDHYNSHSNIHLWSHSYVKTR